MSHQIPVSTGSIRLYNMKLYIIFSLKLIIIFIFVVELNLIKCPAGKQWASLSV